MVRTKLLFYIYCGLLFGLFSLIFHFLFCFVFGHVPRVKSLKMKLSANVHQKFH